MFSKRKVFNLEFVGQNIGKEHSLELVVFHQKNFETILFFSLVIGSYQAALISLKVFKTARSHLAHLVYLSHTTLLTFILIAVLRNYLQRHGIDGLFSLLLN